MYNPPLLYYTLQSLTTLTTSYFQAGHVKTSPPPSKQPRRITILQQLGLQPVHQVMGQQHLLHLLTTHTGPAQQYIRAAPQRLPSKCSAR